MSGIDLSQLAFGALLALIIAGLAFAAKALSRGGAIAAFFLGSIVFGLGGFPWAVLLLAFFVPSTALTLLFKKRKQDIETNYEKGSRRDAWQVLANGGLVGAAAFVHWLSPGSALPWLAASAALAAASADTWATELGSLSRKEPVLITTLKRVVKGTSGGISAEGEIAAFLGSALIATVSLWFFEIEAASSSFSNLEIAALVLTSGFLGCQVDSLLGITLQASYFCPVCNKVTEKHPLHSCGNETVYRRGIRWVNNDWVNLLCGVSAVLMVLLFRWVL